MLIQIKNTIRIFRKSIIQVLALILSKRIIATDKSSLIIAPHPDDESFGCAGLIMKKIQNGGDVYILFLTNGEKSIQTVSETELKEVRHYNAVQALELLGISENQIYWMDLPDGNIPRLGTTDFHSSRDNLLKIIQTLEIKEVYVTHYLDGWSDHIAAYELTVEALKKSALSIDLYLYWVWAWYYLGFKQIFSLPWNRIVLLPIKSVFKTKQKALQVYYDSITTTGEPYMGYLPKIFLKAFEWPYEIYEKKATYEI